MPSNFSKMFKGKIIGKKNTLLEDMEADLLRSIGLRKLNDQVYETISYPCAISKKFDASC